MTEDLSRQSMQTLLALRDISRDDYRRTETHLADLKVFLQGVEDEIASRGNNTAE